MRADLVARLVVTCALGAAPACGRLGFGASLDAIASDSPRDAVVAARCANEIFAEDFEQPLDSSRWSYSQITRGTVAQETAFAHSGSGALASTVDAITSSGAPDEYAVIGHLAALPAAFYVRYFVYTPAAPPNTSWLALSTVENAPGGTGMQIDDALESSRAKLAVETWTLPTTGWPSTSDLATTTWTCIEWYVMPTMETVSQDSVPVIQGQAPTTPYGVFELGVSTYQAPIQPAFEAYFDDVVIATSPIDCTCAP